MGSQRGENGFSGRVVYRDPRRKARQAARRRAEDRAWAAMAGPVAVRRIEDEEAEQPSE